jgi:transcriptional regulator with XRE-family HTH domain
LDGFDFVELIEKELKKQKMSKGEFYSKSSISSATMSQWRNNIYSPSSDAIKKIEKTLNIKISINQKEKPTPVSESELDNEIIMKLMQLTPSEIEKVAAFVEGLIAAR